MPRKQKTIHYLYKTTCLVTGRYYIGIHSTSNLEDGYMGSGKRLRYSIRKHGKENHVKEILEFFDSRGLLMEAEKNAITPDMLNDTRCMNLAEGGTGGHGAKFLTKDQLIKGRLKCDEKLRKKFGNNFKSSIAKQFHEFLSHENRIIWLNKIRRGIKESEFDFGSSFRGKKHSEETKKKMSESSKGMGVGKTNSQYGTMWVTNGTENRKIKKEEVIPEGWCKGRT